VAENELEDGNAPMTTTGSPPTGDPDRDAVVAREREFHDLRFKNDPRGVTGKYYAIESGSADYRRQLGVVRDGVKVLEYGCGRGSAGFDLAASGADVTGIDISAVAIAEAEAEAASKGVAARFLVMDAHRLDLPDRAFDVACGSGILHHLELETALPEIARVMRPDGFGLFYEPLGTNPVINLYRRLTPSLRSADEHPLVPSDIELARRCFGGVEWEVHTFVALAGALLGRLGPARRITPMLVRFDRWLFRRVPWTRRFAWVVVIRLADPRPA